MDQLPAFPGICPPGRQWQRVESDIQALWYPKLTNFLHVMRAAFPHARAGDLDEFGLFL